MVLFSGNGNSTICCFGTNHSFQRAITLGFVQQITKSFWKSRGSLQYLVKSWATIVELISVWKDLESLKKFNKK